MKISPLNKTKKAYRRGAAILAALLCFNMLAGCGILGDGDVNIVTAPPIVEQQVVVTNNYVAEKTRFDVAGTDAFYLLPGIETHPDYLQDFACLDYTDDGWFIYYYCGPAYVSKEEVAKYKGSTGTAPSVDRYPEIDRSKPICDAYIFMKYNPQTSAYQVIDAQGYEHITAAKGQTGMEFYRAETFGFYMLSHAYGVKIFGTHNYFMFDQNGGANIWDANGKNLSSTSLGEVINVKLEEVAANLGAKNGSAATAADLASDGSDDDKKEMEDAIKEVEDVTGEKYDRGDSSVAEIKLNCLIKSAVMDGSGIIYLTVMLYTGESPWVSEVMYNRVISIYSIDLSGDYIKFISTNENYEGQKTLYEKFASEYNMDLTKLKNGATFNFGGWTVRGPDNFTAFRSDSETFNAIIAGLSAMVGVENANHAGFRKEIENLVLAFTGRGSGSSFAYLIRDAVKNFIKSNDWSEYVSILREIGVIPFVGKYATIGGNTLQNFPNQPGNTPGLLQSLAVIHTTGDAYRESGNNLRVSVVNLFPSDDYSKPYGDVYIVPYEYNDEPWYSYHWVKDETEAAKIRDGFSTAFGEDGKKALEEKDKVRIRKIVNNYNNNILSQTDKYTPEQMKEKVIDADRIINALDDKVYKVDDSKTIPAGTIPKSYRMVFPKGATAQFADMNDVEGSTTSSIREGVLLFSDVAQKQDDGTLEYLSKMTAVSEAGGKMLDSGLHYGSAIDTGAVQMYSRNTGTGIRAVKNTSDMWMLITEQGVHFYFISSETSSVQGRRVTLYRNAGSQYIANEQLLSSSGFTLHMENELSHVVLNRPDADADDPENAQYRLDEERLSTYLNSSRVGTLQSASSFTPISEQEVLISAYDTGAAILNFTVIDEESGQFSVLPVKSGSYYQSFNKKDGNVVIVGYDTEDYMYGSMDLARAKVYEFNYNTERDEIYETALEEYLDQLAIDYVRRQYRTRENEDGTRVVIEYSEDTSDEAVLEAALFASDTGDSSAIDTLKTKVEEPKGIKHTADAEEYLKTLRQRVADQKDAMQEILKLTGADKLKTLNDPYWVDLMSRIQNSSDIGNLKDMLCEIELHEDMLSTMPAEDAAIYRQLRKIINYTDEREDAMNRLSQGYSGTAPSDSEGNRQYNDSNAAGIDEESMYATMDRMEARAKVLEDIEEEYFIKHPMPPTYYYGPEGKDDNAARDLAKEDEKWEEYLAELLERISPDNLALSRLKLLDEMAALSYAGASGIPDSQKVAMRRNITDGAQEAETIMDVEELIFAERMKLASFTKYYQGYVEFKAKTWESDYRRIEETRKAAWYKEIKEELLKTEEVQAVLLKNNFTWEQYIQAVVMSVTGKQLKEDMTGEQTTVDSNINPATYFAKLIEFMCEGAGDVDDKTKAKMLEELLRGMQTVNGSQGAEEAIIVVRMMLPAYSGYTGEFERYVATEYETSAEKIEDYHRKDFYRNLIVKMQNSATVKEYLESSQMTWDTYMASLISMAPDAGDPKAAAKEIYGIELSE